MKLPFDWDMVHRVKRIATTREHQLSCIRNWYAFFEIHINADGLYYARFNFSGLEAHQHVSGTYYDGDLLIQRYYFMRWTSARSVCEAIENENLAMVKRIA